MPSLATRDDVEELVQNEVLPNDDPLDPEHVSVVGHISESNTGNNHVKQSDPPSPTTEDKSTVTNGQSGGAANIAFRSDTGVSISQLMPPVVTQPTPERTVRAKDIRCLFIFAAVSCFLFPPTGVACIVITLQAQREWKRGSPTGQMEVVKRKCRLCERLIILSFLAGIIMYVFIIAMIERNSGSSGGVTNHTWGKWSLRG